MPIIYEPAPPILDLRLAAGQGIFNAATLAIGDFIAGENKPWAYYAGAALGYSAVATSIPGATATVFVAATALEMTYLKDVEGGEFAVFVDGVQFAVVNSYAGASAWERLQINFANELLKRVDIVHNGPVAESGLSYGWLAIGALEVDGTAPYIQQESGDPAMAVNLLSVSVQDDDGDTNSIPIYLDDTFTLAQYTGFADAALPIIDAVVGSQIVGCSLTLQIPLVAGLDAAPAQYIENQKGALFSLRTTARYKHGVRLPGFLPELFSGDEVNLTGAGVPGLVNMLTGGLDVGGTQIIPRDGYGNDLVSVATARKSFRKS